MTFLDKIQETSAFLKDKGIQAPEFGLILGSGLGELAEEIKNPVVVDYAEIPNWGRSTVVGHAGKLVYGELAGRKVLALQGRFHFYEGNPLEVVTFPVRVMKVLGCEGVIVTNAAGGIGYGPGTLMAISDHINMTGQNPLMGENLDEFGPRFPDMSKAYTPEYRATAHEVAKNLVSSLMKVSISVLLVQLMKHQQKSVLIRHWEQMQLVCRLFLKLLWQPTQA
ncbi:Purine nucleoside phosphorylase [Streptococcus mitis]|uniref:purine-nucleoside phosphorylase n=1 Tax=Streptococcus mitis TaxID=28037 RepID=A0A150NVH2_STRMT|nr:Purine nucleoside phosphorylase [Streptococcus mitis]